MKVVLLFALLVSGCSASSEPDRACARAADCPGGFCVSGRCLEFDAGRDPDQGAVRFLDVPFRTTDARPRPSPPCDDALPPAAEHLVVNEILVNVPPGSSGDANGDGIRDPYDDEFVEIVSVADGPVDLSRVQIQNGGRTRFAFEPFCLRPGESIVVFGGGSVSQGLPGNAVVSPDRFTFGNGGGTVLVTGPAGEIGRLEYESSPPASYTRRPQVVGTEWTDHRQWTGMTSSPGRCADGQPLTLNCTSETSSPDGGRSD